MRVKVIEGKILMIGVNVDFGTEEHSTKLSLSIITMERSSKKLLFHSSIVFLSLVEFAREVGNGPLIRWITSVVFIIL